MASSSVFLVLASISLSAPRTLEGFIYGPYMTIFGLKIMVQHKSLGLRRLRAFNSLKDFPVLLCRKGPLGWIVENFGAEASDVDSEVIGELYKPIILA